MSIRSLLRNYLGMEQREIDVNYGMMRLASQAATNSSAIVDLNNRSTELDGRVTGQINDLVTRVTNEIRRVNGRIQRSERRTENCEAGIGQMNYMLLAQRPNASGSEGQESLEDGDAFKQANENLNQAGIGSPDGIYRDPGKMLPPTPGYRPTKWRKAVKRIEDLPVIGDALIGLATPFAIPTAAATAIDGSKIKSLYEERKGTVGKVIGGLACDIGVGQPSEMVRDVQQGVHD